MIRNNDDKDDKNNESWAEIEYYCDKRARLAELWTHIENYKLTNDDIKFAIILLLISLLAWSYPFLRYWWWGEFDMGLVWFAVLLSVIPLPWAIDILLFKRYFTLRLGFFITAIVSKITSPRK